MKLKSLKDPLKNSVKHSIEKSVSHYVRSTIWTVIYFSVMYSGIDHAWLFVCNSVKSQKHKVNKSSVLKSLK
jgi:hypothetical protein